MACERPTKDATYQKLNSYELFHNHLPEPMSDINDLKTALANHVQLAPDTLPYVVKLIELYLTKSQDRLFNASIRILPECAIKWQTDDLIKDQIKGNVNQQMK